MAAGTTTATTFTQDVLEAKGLVLVDFWAPWCAPCLALAPILDEIASENRQLINILKINVEDYPEVAVDHQITSLPALKLFRAGRLETTIIGAKPKSALVQTLAPYLTDSAQS